ncbi:MAG TPA: hypothetical protein VLH18_08935 [Candidatus Limnocylindrales bacterium]|nr:hypothetical protein [Candidatus Limnocylindrales bacterium]
MQKRYMFGLLRVMVLLIACSFVVLLPQTANAVEPKTAAVNAAVEAISELPPVSQIVAVDQIVIVRVAEARALVEKAREEHFAVDADFPNLADLLLAERRVARVFAIHFAKEAVRALPPREELTPADRPAVVEARRLVNIAIEEHGVTPFELCWPYDALIDAEDQMDEFEPEPEPAPVPEVRQPTPPTGGLSGLLPAGSLLLFSGTVTLIFKQRKRRHRGFKKRCCAKGG